MRVKGEIWGNPFFKKTKPNGVVSIVVEKQKHMFEGTKMGGMMRGKPGEKALGG